MTAHEDLHHDLAALIGSTLHDRYEVEKLLGAGGMGAVFKARHTGLARDVAIKVLHPELARDPSTGKRFEREATSASRLDHPNCVRVTDFGTTSEGVTYLVMELLAGAELLDRMGKPWPPSEAVAVIKQILEGLEHAHHVGIVHRDLKPENVFLTTDFRGEELVKLVDFGIAKLLDEQGAEKLTRQGIVFGTPRYMSPEQAAGGKIDARTDLYALGLIFYELLAGRPPFVADEAPQLLRMQIMVPPPPLPDTVPSELAAVVMKMLEKSKSDRYADARAVLDALGSIEDVIAAAPVAAMSNGAEQAVAIGATASLTAATAGVAAATVPPTGLRDGPAPTTRPEHSGVAWEPASAPTAQAPIRSGATIASDASLPVLSDPNASGRLQVGPTGSHPSLSTPVMTTPSGSHPTVPTAVAGSPAEEPSRPPIVAILIVVIVLLGLGAAALVFSGVLSSEDTSVGGGADSAETEAAVLAAEGEAPEAPGPDLEGAAATDPQAGPSKSADASEGEASAPSSPSDDPPPEPTPAPSLQDPPFAPNNKGASSDESAAPTSDEQAKRDQEAREEAEEQAKKQAEEEAKAREKAEKEAQKKAEKDAEKKAKEADKANKKADKDDKKKAKKAKKTKPR